VAARTTQHPASTEEQTVTDPFAFAHREHVHPSRNWHNCCAMFTRMAFDAPAIGDFDGDGMADAEDVWKAAKDKHLETDPMKIPRGVWVFWSGGSADNGHAAGPTCGDGTVWGTDLLHDGKVDRYPIADVHKRWGLTLVGWAADINGKPTGYRPPAPPAPKPVGANVEKAETYLHRAKAKAKDPARRSILLDALRALRGLRK
jgi:hypothetical protein